ncbi:PAS domain S-box-containing protein/diguanylate cyclase (GGDEF) domain-containing protein [Paenibacillus tianmuensis]|uniref:PAS domain S-box-containing protein/diguanylate cyclase (GGDEF) domain-containing protein n=1 Tax=Paenibacillus tianmuensis TaxID=624147 RepID=A0A1G4T0Z2_9BACL|nr:EAL domain-containing protein [Paenibacillus tianmuensis]SCW74199.1 PAS domain S-box-containing protein/diguanylate cyclase (GGDEF) domain-containing protein [Paenibacillus tianmuensis]
MPRTDGSANGTQPRNEKRTMLFACGGTAVGFLVCWWVGGAFLWGFGIAVFLLMAYSWERIIRLSRAVSESDARSRTAEKRLRRADSQLNALFHHHPGAVGLIDPGGCFLYWNPAAERTFGYREEELRGKHLRTLFPEELSGGINNFFAEALHGLPLSFKTSLLHKDGYRVDLDTTVVPVKEQGIATGVLIVCQDITSATRTEEQIRHLAYYDDMTGLPNRRLFVQHLNAAMAAASRHERKLAVLFVDIDRFKIVNDCFGHDYGDMLLLQVAERFSRCLGPDDYLARTEGDEFALFFQVADQEAEPVGTIAKEIFDVLEEPFVLGQNLVHLTVSIGISLLSREDESADLLMKCADMALTRAKEKGKNNYQLFNSEMKSVSLKRLTLESELRRALAKNELLLHYQPQMDITTGRIVGFEALVRWQHPERGLVAPGEFIPFAEESGLIVPIGEWALKEACRQNKQWQDAGLEVVPVSVNLSIRQFMQHQLCVGIGRILRETGLDPALLELEITESCTMDVDYACGLLHELKQLGVKISIDDFGTGYSSLSYLKKFPIDKLKIDRSFVRDILTDPNDAAIVASIIAMTRHLNMEVIAEGVEIEEQLRFLHDNDCHLIQGFYLSPPLAVPDAERLMKLYSTQAAAEEERPPVN